MSAPSAPSTDPSLEGATRGPPRPRRPAGFLVPRVVVAATALLAAAAAAVVARDVAGPAPSRHEAFQRLVGGLGGGPAIALSPCERAFDPRLDAGCRFDVSPVPCGSPFCAHGAGGLPYARDGASPRIRAAEAPDARPR